MDKKRIKIDHFPKYPGIYFFLDHKGVVLYVGKAKNLNSRIKSYFLKSLDRGPMIDQMLTKAFSAKYKETESEIEAVFLEAELIKKLRPKYNVSLKDDKSFNFIRISKEEFPCVGLVRSREISVDSRLRGNDSQKRNSKPHAELFGPYPAGLALKKSIRYLRRIFQYRDCNQIKYSSAYKKHRACLYGDISICSAPCINKISKEEYGKNINYFKKFLRGKKKEIIKNLERDMKSASKSGNFETAAQYRDKILALNHLHEVAIGLRDDSFDSSKILFNRIECYDISNIMGDYAVGAMSVVTSGKIDTNEYRKFKIKTVKGANDLAMLEEILIRRFKNNWPNPDLIIIDGGVNQLGVALKVIAELKLESSRPTKASASNDNYDIPIVSIAKGAKRDKNELHFSNQNIAQYIKKTPAAEKSIILARNEAHRFAIKYYRHLHRKDMMN